MELFMIGGRDFTKNITVPNYKVNEKPVYDEYIDANKKVHRDTLRHQVEGSISFLFYDVEKYYEFLDVIRDNTNVEGYVTVSLYINNKRTFETKNVFIDLGDLPELEPVIGLKGNVSFDISILEQ